MPNRFIYMAFSNNLILDKIIYLLDINFLKENLKFCNNLKMRWNEAVTLQFVKIYLKHECLWNPAHPGYKVKYQRDKAYAEICTEFKHATMKSLSVPEVKIKIKNLRTTYAQQVNKILQKSSPDCIYEPSLIWFHEMDRCMKHIPTNRHSSSLYSNSVSIKNMFYLNISSYFKIAFVFCQQ